MPIKRCTLKNGQLGYKWGDQGTCYPSRGSAERQASAAYVSGYHEKKGQNVLDLQLIAKENPYHDEEGKFTTADQAVESVGVRTPLEDLRKEAYYQTLESVLQREEGSYYSTSSGWEALSLTDKLQMYEHQLGVEKIKLKETEYDLRARMGKEGLDVKK